MKRPIRGVVMAAALSLGAGAGAGQAVAQQDPATVAAPRNPSRATAGLTANGPQKTDQTVDSIDHKLLSEEKDRPHLPGQAPSPSTAGVRAGAGATTATPPPPHR